MILSLPVHIQKHDILNAIIGQLQADVLILERAVSMARDTATHADCLGSSKYETMRLEASYLAQGQGVRLLEIERALEYFRRVNIEESASIIATSSLLVLAGEQGSRQLLWLAAEAGGLKVQHGELTIMVITPASPLGQKLIGKEAGDEFEITIAGTRRCYEIAAVIRLGVCRTMPKSTARQG